MKKTMKKLAALGLSLTMMMSLAACGNSASEQPAAEPEAEETPAETPEEEAPAEQKVQRRKHPLRTAQVQI